MRRKRFVWNAFVGPVEQVDDTTFTVRFYRMGMYDPRRTSDIWLLASHPGDKNYKGAVQQANLRIPYRLTEGKRPAHYFSRDWKT